MISTVSLDKKIRTYKTDGKDDSVEINFALGHQGLINLYPGQTYSISDPLIFQSNIVLNGFGATLKLAPNLPIWGGRNVSISQEKALLMAASGCKNITLKNLVIDGSQSDFYPKIKLGTSCYNMATLIGVDGLTIENCLFKNGCNDAMLLSNCSNVKILKTNVNNAGHDGVYAWKCLNITVDGCKFVNRTNSSTRFYYVENGVFSNNLCSTSGGGCAGLELEGDIINVEVFGNKIYRLPYPGIWSYQVKKQFNLNIHDNFISGCKSPGISVGKSGSKVWNNIIK
jgi:hypothetical protein